MKKGQAFELAVHDFVKRLAPDATVIFDHKVKDRDTGTYRQVDVWIETRFANHFPLSILVSCKDFQRKKIDISHIGTFINEVRSTGASTGVMYSRSGFTRPALEKALSNGLSCCRLYDNQPADLPEVLIFTDYLSTPSFRLHYVDSQGIQQSISTWGDLLDLETVDGKTAYDEILEDYSEISKIYRTEAPKCELPRDTRYKMAFDLINGARLVMYIDIHFKHYKGNLSAHIINGSYCLSDGNFYGNQRGPIIDTQCVRPGPGWDEVPWTEDLPPRTCVAFFTGGMPVPEQIQSLRKTALSITT